MWRPIVLMDGKDQPWAHLTVELSSSIVHKLGRDHFCSMTGSDGAQSPRKITIQRRERGSIFLLRGNTQPLGPKASEDI